MAKKIEPPKRGEVFLVNFDPTIGAEIKKTRPALIHFGKTHGNPNFTKGQPQMAALREN